MSRLPLLIAASILYSCSTSMTSQDAVDSVAVLSDSSTPQTVTVCFWDELGVRETPGEKGKYLTTIYLGEILEPTGDSLVEASGKTNHTYYKVTLSDGKQGWVRGDLIAKDAKLAGVVNQTTIYKRPDLATLTETYFLVADIVAVQSESNGWAKVKGKRLQDKWYAEGYVRTEDLTFSPNEVEFALLYRKASNSKPEISQAIYMSIHGEDRFNQTNFYQSIFGTPDMADDVTEVADDSQDDFDDHHVISTEEKLASVGELINASDAEGDIVNIYGSDEYWYVFGGKRYRLEEKSAETIIEQTEFFHCTQEQLDSFEVGDKVLNYIPARGSGVN